ncbi:hypothetical protein [Carboxylicivirga sp. RSCT41]|uniref:hypothetical protein n=1 Tax=Carboxylicivirga agarovorans TaxID=3417570 RepID=UPI003D34EA03
MKYCKHTTKQHHIAISHSNCVESIDDITINEGARRSPFNGELAVNLDKVEAGIARTNRTDPRKTVDMVFGVSDNNGRQCRMVLCEYRLRYKNANNLSKTELDSKVANSRGIIGQSPQIATPHICVFSDKIKQEAYNRIRRLYAHRKVFSVMTVSELKSEFF